MAVADEELEIALLLQRKIKLGQELVALAKEAGLAFYNPSPKQDAFHRAGLTSKRRMVRAGNRFGKSTCGVAEDCAWVLHERVWYPESDNARRGGLPQHPVKLLTITTDWDKVDEIFTGQKGEGGKVWKFLPTAALADKNPTRRNHSGAIDTIALRDGSIWRFDTVKSFAANPMGSESSDWDAIHVDEPCPEQMFKAAARGLIDRNGSAWFTLTPLSEFWINDFFFPQDTGGKLRDDVWSVNASIYDNPFLTREAIDEFEKLLSDDEKTCRLHGIPLHLSGLIYKEFAWDQHVLTKLPEGWNSPTEPPRHWPVYLQFDVHPRTPHCVLFSTVMPSGERIYFNDIFHHCTMEELADLVREKLDGRRVIWSEMDPLGWQEHPLSETTMADDLCRCGIYVEKATKALSRGVLRVKHALKTKTALFTTGCKRTLWEVQRYCWDEETNKPLDVDDHAMECLYRMEVAEPRWVDVNVRTAAIDDIEITNADLNLSDMEYIENE